MTEKFDLVVIGGGSGGLAAAQRAAEYGAKVVLAEVGRLGGTCVNVGCVPKKIMWNAAELGAALHEAADYGFRVEMRGLDWGALKARRDAYIERLNAIYAANLARRSIELVRARASFIDAHTVSAGERRLRAEHILIATGSRPRLPAIPGVELGITSDGFFELSERPRRAAVVGSSYIAIELAGIFAGLGTETTLVMRGDTALKTFDDMLGEVALTMLRADGVEIATNTVPVGLTRAAHGAIELKALDGRVLGPYDCVVWAIGRGAVVEDLALERAGVGLDTEAVVARAPVSRTRTRCVRATGCCTPRTSSSPPAAGRACRR